MPLVFKFEFFEICVNHKFVSSTRRVEGRAYKPVWAPFGWRGGTKLWVQRGPTLNPGLWHKPGLMVMGQGRGALVPVGATNRYQCTPFNPCWCYQPGPKAPVLPASGPKFSPTLLVERGAQWFISPTAAPLSSSSPPQAFGPTCYCFAWWAFWVYCGPESWPIVGFHVVFRPWWPNRWQFLFYFSSFFVLFFALFIFFCFLLYFLIVFAFRSAKL